MGKGLGLMGGFNRFFLFCGGVIVLHFRENRLISNLKHHLIDYNHIIFRYLLPLCHHQPPNLPRELMGLVSRHFLLFC